MTSGAECDGTNRTGSGNRALDARTTFETSRGFDFASITYVGGQAGGGAKKSRTPKKSTRTYPRKPFKIGHVRERSATDARALAWEAAASMGEDDRTVRNYQPGTVHDFVSMYAVRTACVLRVSAIGIVTVVNKMSKTVGGSCPVGGSMRGGGEGDFHCLSLVLVHPVTCPRRLSYRNEVSPTL